MSSNISLQDFLDSTTVTVINYTQTDATHVHVEYNVVINANERTGVFMTDIDTSLLSEGFTTQDVLNAAWDSVKSNVNAWTIVNAAHEKFTVHDVQSTDSNFISLQDFTDNFTAQLVRYELYPPNQPTHWCVGFNVVKDNTPKRSMYIDGLVPLADWCNNVFCASVADTVWDQVKSRVSEWAAAELALPSVVNTTYTPTSV